MFPLFLLLFFIVWFLCIICVKSIINLWQHGTLQPIVLAGYLDSLCWTHKQIGLMNLLLEQNSFICRGLTLSSVILMKSIGQALIFFPFYRGGGDRSKETLSPLSKIIDLGLGSAGFEPRHSCSSMHWS